MKTAIALLLLPFCAHALDEERLADAIKRAEGDEMYGIRSCIVSSEPEARRVCLNTIRHQTQRWEAAGRPEPLIKFIGESYCPMNDPNDIEHINQYWVYNVTWFYNHPEKL